jgi:hypothetical protein
MSIEGMVAICSECKSQQKDSYILKNALGFSAPCRFCGGVLAVVPEQIAKNPDELQRVKNRMDDQRHIGHDVDKKYID